jgi:DNA repair ATPase RecN
LTQEEMAQALAELSEVQKLAEPALVSRDADEFAKGALQRLSRLSGGREKALAKLREALAALELLAGSEDEEVLKRCANELRGVIAAAEKANCDKAEVAAAKAALNKSESSATLMAELKACKDALDFCYKFTSDGTWAPRLQGAVDVLTPAVVKARTYEVEPSRLQEAEERLTEASKLIEKHGKALAELTHWTKETDAAHTRVSDGLHKAKESWGGRPSLKECVASLERAIERGEKGRVDDALIDRAKHIIVPARSTARFGKALTVVERFDAFDA